MSQKPKATLRSADTEAVAAASEDDTGFRDLSTRIFS